MKIIFVIILNQFFYNCFSKVVVDKKNQNKPNIIVLFADDLGYGDLGCYGHPSISTPNLDQMAAEGMKFTQFYASSSLCSPSRASLLTGRLPVRTGAYGKKNHVFFCDANGGLPESEITLADILKEQDYQTACIGKWHLGHKPAYLPTSKGFDYFFGLPYSNDMSPLNNPTWDGVSHCRPLPLMRNAEIIENEPNQDSLTIRYTAEAINFIEKNKENNFFLYLPYNFPHTPLHVSDNFKQTSIRGLYGDVLNELDWSVGYILNYLKETGLDKNTLVFFTSDNGPWLMRQEYGGSAGPLKEGKGTTWEGGVRVPAIAWWPSKIKRGQVNQSSLSTMDLFATIAKIVDYSLPDDRTYDGKEFCDVIFNGIFDNDRLMFFYKGEELYAVRKGPWKIHLCTINKPFLERNIMQYKKPLLYNVEVDPGEKFNLNDKYPEIVSELLTDVENHLANLEKAIPEFDK